MGELLGKPAYRAIGQPQHLRPEELPEGEAFIDIRVDVRDFESLAHVQELGFTVIDCSLFLERSCNDDSRKRDLDDAFRAVRFAEKEDELGVRALAREAFEFDRFHRDPRIPNGVAKRIKEEWAANFFSGSRGTWMVISTDNEGVSGFLQLLLSPKDGTLLIDLVAVSARCRRQGVARSMIEFALRNCGLAFSRISVGTQLSNRPSVQLYEAEGFRLSNLAYVLHLHKESR